ncbi:hypothetical protein HispidOSU_030137, partial [Sigmodon hispidus]
DSTLPMNTSLISISTTHPRSQESDRTHPRCSGVPAYPLYSECLFGASSQKENQTDIRCHCGYGTHILEASEESSQV